MTHCYPDLVVVVVVVVAAVVDVAAVQCCQGQVGLQLASGVHVSALADRLNALPLNRIQSCPIWCYYAQLDSTAFYTLAVCYE